MDPNVPPEISLSLFYVPDVTQWRKWQEIVKIGLVSECQFQRPVGLCVEFYSVAYVCDAQSDSLKIIAPISERVRFLKAGNLYDAFSVHKEGQSPPPRIDFAKKYTLSTKTRFGL